MIEYLTSYVRKNIWCTPNQDMQRIWKPARITPINGVRNTFKLMWATYELPTMNERYHVYQIGQNHPLLLGIPDVEQTWQKITDVCNSENLIIDIYTAKGLHLPRFDAYIWKGPEKTILVAVKINYIIADLNEESLFIRFYKNALFRSVRHDENDGIFVNGKLITTPVEQLTIQNEILTYMTRPGYVYCFANGQLVENITPFNSPNGTFVEFVWDSSIKSVIDLDVNDLEAFDSILDNNRKYLLHYEEDNDGIIDYRDDIDVYLFQRLTPPTQFKGCYYHKNNDDGFRQLTHKDYSISIQYMESLALAQGWSDNNQTTVRMHIREAGYVRPLVFEHNRIHELYKLSDTDVKAALLGIDSNVSVWRADYLENSAYPKVMGDQDWRLDGSEILDVLGYNAASKLVGESIKKVVTEGGWRYVDVPLAYQRSSSVCEYDEDGLLLGFYSNINDRRHSVVNPECTHVEFVAGEGSDDQGTVFGNAIETILPDPSYRFYTCPIYNNIPTEEWTDVTGGDDYMVSDNQVVWTVNAATTFTAIRGDHKHLIYEFDLERDDSLLKFTINASEPRYNIINRRAATIPPAKLDIWMNRHILIENLDYFVQWPEVVITNKEYFTEDLVNIVVRAYGFCKEDLTREIPRDVGFIERDLLSRNNRFDIRDDKTLRFNVNGGLITTDDLDFSETDSGVYAQAIPNGSPYVIDDHIVPMYGLGEVKTYQYREESQVIDNEVSDYLTLKLPEPEFETPSIIPDRHRVFSPLCSKVMRDLQENIIPLAEIQGHYGSDKVFELMEPYMYLLDYEPTKKGIDTRYVVVEPHAYDTVQQLNIYQYTFLERVVKLLLEDRVDLTNHISVISLGA